MLLYKHTLREESGDLHCLLRSWTENEGETGEERETVKQAEMRSILQRIYPKPRAASLQSL